MEKEKNQYKNRVMMMAGTGALISGTGAAAANLKKIRNLEISSEEAFKNTAKETLTGAASTALTSVVVEGMDINNRFLKFTGYLVTAVGIKYFLDSLVTKSGIFESKLPLNSCPVPAAEAVVEEAPQNTEKPKKVAKKSPAKKTAKK